jgi:phthalate 4,5-dioxygenase oxygenase subunit
MLTQADNETLTRVEGDAPMGRMIRENYWIPFSRSVAIVAGAAPLAVRLLGHNYVAFRGTNNRVGFLDERCPHRGTSLLLARNEGCKLRCIFHGWSFDTEGRVVDVPTQSVNAEKFAARVPVRHFPVVERGGLLWVWLGKAPAPALPKLPFLDLPDANVWTCRTICKSNWFQGVEGALDSAHINALHLSWVEKFEQHSGTHSDYAKNMTQTSSPKFDAKPTAYGLRAAAMRGLPGGESYLRITEYFAPFQSLVAVLNCHDGIYFAAVPMDDVSHMLFMVEYSPRHAVFEPTGGIAGEPGNDCDNFANINGTRENRWTQDRKAMDAGHFSGFTRNAIMEDVVVQLSMGPIADRTKEFLSSTDMVIVRARKLAIEAATAFASGKLPPGSALSGEVTIPTPVNTVLPADTQWEPHADRSIAAEASA